jgi:hypothetical protein
MHNVLLGLDADPQGLALRQFGETYGTDDPAPPSNTYGPDCACFDVGLRFRAMAALIKN